MSAVLLLANYLSASDGSGHLFAQTQPDISFSQLGEAVQWTGAIPESPKVQSAEEMPVTRSVGTTSTSGFTIDRMSRNAVVAAYHEYYMASEGYASLINWTGDASICDAGTVAAAFQDDVLRRINYYRAQVGLPADIFLDATKNAKSQEAALMMAANNALAHNPPVSWTCYTADGYEAASKGNLALGTFGSGSIDAMILDDGINNTVVGHRRWLLYSRAQEMGSGSVPSSGTYPYSYPVHNSASCIWVIGDAKPVQPAQGVAWPNDGYVPWSLVPNDGNSYPRWSYSYPGADFSSATVTMSQGGVPVPVVLESLAINYADDTLVWRPSGIPDAAPVSDTPYIVTISGISGPITSASYTVTLIDPFTLNDLPVISGTASPVAGVASTYNFTQTDQADDYELTIFEDVSGTWSEGAEASPAPQVIDGTTGYDLLSSYTSASGLRAFHLATPDFVSGDSFAIDRDILPESGSTISFQYRRLFMHPDTKLRVELSSDGGSSYSTIESIDGFSTGSSAEWDSSFLAASVAVPAQFIDEAVRLRFRLEPTGSTFIGTGDSNGIYIDDISVSNSREFINPSTQSIAGSASSFDFTPAIGGQSYQLALRPQLGGQAFAYGPLLSVISQSPPVPVITSADEVWGAQGEVFSYAITATNAPTSFGATGLPTGASINTATGVITGQIAVGDHSGVNLSATNAGGSGTAFLTIHVLSGYEQAANDLYPGLGMPEEDDDQDGTPNIVELGIGGRDPLIADSFSASNFSVDSSSGSDFVLSLKKSGVAGLDYTARGSDSLQNGSWVTNGISILTDTESDFEVSYPIITGGRYFIEIDISQNGDTTSLPAP